MFWGPNSMVPQPKDFWDFFANIRYFLYLGERPPGDRWTYFEKFDYLAVFWGVAIIGISGLFLWAPDFFTRFLPGWTLNAAYVIHSDEAAAGDRLHLRVSLLPHASASRELPDGYRGLHG